MPLLFTTLKYYQQLYTRLPANQWNQLPLLSVLLHMYLILGHLQYSSTYFKDYSRCCLLILYCRIHLFNISSIRQKESKVRFKSAAGDLIPLQKWSLGRQAETPRLSCLESVTAPLPLFSLWRCTYGDPPLQKRTAQTLFPPRSKATQEVNDTSTSLYCLSLSSVPLLFSRRH